MLAHKAQDPAAVIALEAAIDHLLYRLYGPTAEEDKNVEVARVTTRIEPCRRWRLYGRESDN
jgi:hypothetical protein